MRTPPTAVVAGLVLVATVAAPGPATAGSRTHRDAPESPRTVVLASGLAGGSGSAIGPDGALYVAEPGAGRIARIDRETGAVSAFATGLPAQNPGIGLGGVMDVAFADGTAYALVTLVGPDVGGSHVDGIYRIDSPTGATVVADIGSWAIAHPPDTDFFVPSGLQYAMEVYRDGFLVTDGHHNRVLRVTRDGRVSEALALDNVVPTGLARRGNQVYLAQAGAVPHLPADGRVIRFETDDDDVVQVSAGAPLLVDVELRGRTLYALSQGTFGGGDPGSPASPGTGALVRADGPSLVGVVGGLDRPTSLEVAGRTAFVVGMTGQVWRIDGLPTHSD